MFPYLRAWLVLIAAASCCLTARAVEVSPLTDLHLESWGTGDGLPHNMVHDIAQTPDGYLWFGTWEGLARFNGYEFRVFRPENTPGLEDRGVRSLAVDHDGVLWAGTARGGVSSYDGTGWTATTETEGLAGNEILELLVDARNRVWVATERSGVSIIAASGITTVDRTSGLSDNTVLALFEAADGSVWLATRQGVDRYDDGEIRNFSAAAGLPIPEALPLSFETSPSGALLIGTEAGMFELVGDRFLPVGPALPEGLGQVSELLRTKDGSLWNGTFASGLLRIQGEQLSRLNTRLGLPNNRVTALFEDREQNLWVGTSGGLARLRTAVFTTLSMRSGLSDNYVRSVLASPSGDVYVGTSNGLNRLRGDTVVHWREGQLLSNSILSLWEDQAGSLWIGTYGAGLNRLLPDGRIDAFTAPDALPSNHVRTIVEDDQGTLWIGTARGLVRQRGDERTFLTREQGLPSDYITALHQAADGSIWVGSYESMVRIAGDEITVLNGSPGYDGSDVFGFWQGAGEDLWIATETGLLRYREGTFTRISAAKGLPHEVLFSVLGDDEGFLWMSSNAGIFRAPLEQLHEAADGRRTQVYFDAFTEADGLGSRQANGGSTPAASRGPDGELWFATSRGAATVLPSQVDQARLTVRPPSMVIEALEVDGTPVDVTERARIVPGTRHLEIAFAGLMLRAPDRIDYRYRLIGYDDEWSAPTRLRTAHYTNLDPGPYEFQVQAGVGGAWGEELATLAFHVEPHFYETRWFSGLVVAAAFVLLWVGVRWRVADLRRRAQFLAREIADRTRALRDRTRQLEIANEEKLDLLRELERQSRAFERQAREDALTGLANRRRFDERMARAFKSLHNMESTKLAVAMLDIDHFKRINDTHSHQTGDAVLKVIGKELRRLEAEGLLAARYGGEEFALLFDNWSGPEAARRCERLRQTIESTVLGFIHPDLQVTISIGISDRTDLPNHEKMISDADDQLYLAKRAGRNRVYFDGRPVDSGPEEMATQSAD